MQKALELMNLKLTNVISDITGVTGMEIIRTLIAGEHRPSILAQLRDGRCKKSEDEIVKSLEGNYRSEHLFVLQQAVSRRKRYNTTQRQANARPAPDLVERNFGANGPDELWVADIAYVSTWTGWLYLAVVIDAWSRRVVGWATATHLRTQLVLDALAMAIWQRRPQDVIHHSDQGSQYTSLAFGKRCREAGVRPSMGSVGDCFDNAMCESFFATLECDLLDREIFHSPVEARQAVFAFIEGWYNLHRLHSALGYTSPVQFERSHTHHVGSPSPHLSTKAG
jgi:putative transposase